MILHQRQEHPDGDCLAPASDETRRQWGASLVEYALLLALITMACVGAVSYFGQSSGNSVDRSSTCLATAGTPLPDCP